MSFRLWGTKASQDDAAAEQTWPPTGTQAWVRLPCCEVNVHPTKVVGHVGESLRIEAPRDPHPTPVDPPPRSRKFAVGWSEGSEHKQVRVWLTSCDPVADTDIDQWTVKPVARPYLVHRRAHFRADWDAEITCEVPSIHGPAVGRILDISAGGLRCEIPFRGEPKNPSFPVSFAMKGATHTFDTEIAWWGEAEGETVQIGLRFVGLSNEALTELQHHVSDVERENRRRR